MSDASPNSVTRDDLRHALASGPRRRPTNLLGGSEGDRPAWEWDAELPAGEQLELAELRQVTADQRDEIQRLCAAQEAAAEREQSLRSALSDLAGAGLLRRRKVVAALRARGLV